jgi:hypothetical protein
MEAINHHRKVQRSLATIFRAAPLSRSRLLAASDAKIEI